MDHDFRYICVLRTVQQYRDARGLFRAFPRRGRCQGENKHPPPRFAFVRAVKYFGRYRTNGLSMMVDGRERGWMVLFRPFVCFVVSDTEGVGLCVLGILPT